MPTLQTDGRVDQPKETLITRIMQAVFCCAFKSNSIVPVVIIEESSQYHAEMSFASVYVEGNSQSIETGSTVEMPIAIALDVVEDNLVQSLHEMSVEEIIDWEFEQFIHSLPPGGLRL